MAGELQDDQRPLETITVRLDDGVKSYLMTMLVYVSPDGTVTAKLTSTEGR